MTLSNEFFGDPLKQAQNNKGENPDSPATSASPRPTTPAIPNSPASFILMWAFNLAGETIDSIPRLLPSIDIRSKQAVLGDILQSAIIVGTLIHIEMQLGKKDYAKLHSGIVRAIDQSVRSRFMAGIQELCRFLLEIPPGGLQTDFIPALDRLCKAEDDKLEAVFGLWIAWSFFGRKPESHDELRFMAAMGTMAYASSSSLIASMFLSDKRRMEGLT